MSFDSYYDTIELSIGSTRTCSHNVTPALESGVLVDSITDVTDVTNAGSATGDLTISSKQKNSTAYTEDETGDTVAVGKAIQWTISSTTTAPTKYKLKIVYTTDATPADTVVDYVYVLFR